MPNPEIVSYEKIIKSFLKDGSLELPPNRLQYFPRPVFLDAPRGVAKVGDAIANGFPVILDCGATWATAFDPKIREAVAYAREEKTKSDGSLEPVSLIASYEDTVKWVDQSNLGPISRDCLRRGLFRILEQVAFLRFPATQRAIEKVGPYCVNAKSEIQVFFTPNSDPVLSYLRKKHHLPFFAVRSTNMSGRPEEPFFLEENSSSKGAWHFAHQIMAPIIAVAGKNWDDVRKESKKERIGSYPIIVIEPNDTIRLVRQGNTDPETIKRLLDNLLSRGMTFVYEEEKPISFTRKSYSVSSIFREPLIIHQKLLEAAGIRPKKPHVLSNLSNLKVLFSSLF